MVYFPFWLGSYVAKSTQPVLVTTHFQIRLLPLSHLYFLGTLYCYRYGFWPGGIIYYKVAGGDLYFSISTVISPVQQCKSVVVDVTHNISLSKLCSANHVSLNSWKINGRINKPEQAGFHCLPDSILTPFST